VYSSARFYQTGNDEFEFLTHWKDRWPLHSSVRTRTTAYLFVVTIVRQDTDNGIVAVIACDYAYNGGQKTKCRCLCPHRRQLSVSSQSADLLAWAIVRR
jgi:hypothetical protein